VRQMFRNEVLVVLSVFLISCAAQTQTAADSRADNRSFTNVLVIGVANDYNARAQFERNVVSELKASGMNSAAYYSVVGGNKPIDRATIDELIVAEGFDGVLITKVLNRDTQSTIKTGSTATRATRKEGRAVDLFRYEYQELNEPATLDIDLTVTISSELFSVTDGEKVWEIEAQISEKEALGDIVAEAVTTVIRRLRKDEYVD
jgi:hypothetical protein